MSPNTSLHVVDLQPDSKEYKEVVSKFEQTMRKVSSPAVHGRPPFMLPYARFSATVPLAQPAAHRGIYNSIIKIQRIQNILLYAQYIAKKKNMDKNSKPGLQNEMLLFHGTSADTCLKINQQGFNRSFCGKNGMSTHYSV